MSHKGRLRFPTCRANWSRRLRRSRLAGCRSGFAYGWSSPFFRTFVIGFESVLDAVILVTNRTHHLYKLRVWETVIIVNLHVHTVCMYMCTLVHTCTQCYMYNYTAKYNYALDTSNMHRLYVQCTSELPYM